MKRPKKDRGFALTKYFIVWVALFIVAVVFSQTMPNSIAAVLLIVVSALPFIDLLYVLIGKAAVRASLLCDTVRAEKKSSVNYSIDISNASPLPFPFIDAEFIVPDEAKASCGDLKCMIPLLPFGRFTDKRSVVFKYRGNYVFGIKSVYIYDLLKFYRVRVSREKQASVFIAPRRIDVDFGAEKGIADSPTARVDNAGYDRSEQTEIKEYAPGDPMKTVHWKLSGKTQSLMVKKFSSETGQRICVFADLCARHPVDEDSGNCEDINAYCADAIVETVCSYMTAHLRRDESVRIVFHDTRVPTDNGSCVNRVNCDSLTDFEDFFEYFGAAPVPPALPFSDFSEDSADEVNTYVYVLSYLSDEIVERLCETVDVSRKTEIILCEPFARMRRGAEMKRIYDNYTETLFTYGMTVIPVCPEDYD